MTYVTDTQEYCVLPNPHGSSNTCGSGTPLPKPGKFRSSASIKRASRHSRGISTADQRMLRELETTCEKTTPAGALRSLEGIRETNQGQNKLPTSADNSSPDISLGPLSASVNRPTPSEIIAGFDGSPHTGRMERSASYHGARATTPQVAAQNEQLAALIATVKMLPASLSLQIEQALGREESQTEARRQEQRQAILDVLDAAESRAEARELRLQGLLAEVSMRGRITLTGRRRHLAVIWSGRLEPNE